MSFFYIKEELMQGGLHGKIVLFFIASLLLTSCASTTSGRVSKPAKGKSS